MAGDWIKWTKGLTRRREVLGIASRMSVPPAHAAGLCMVFWEWLDDNVTAAQTDENGNACVTLGSLQPDFIDSLVCASGFAAALTAEGWLCARSGSLTVPNYCRHNGQTSKDRALTAERVNKSRSKNRQKCNAETVTPVTPKPLPEKRREEKRRIQKPISTGCIDSIRFPPPFHDQPVKDAFARWFSYLGKRGKMPLDLELAAVQAVQFFPSPEELIQSIGYAILNGYITLKNYSAEIAPRRQGSQGGTDDGVVAKAFDSLDAEMRAEEASRK